MEDVNSTTDDRPVPSRLLKKSTSVVLDIRETYLVKRRSFPDSDVSRFTFHLSRTTGTGLEWVAKNNGFAALRTG
jgi:hypothetical protein